MSSVKISSNIRPRETEAFSRLSIKNKAIIKRIQNRGLRIAKTLAPVKSGRFRNGIRIVESKSRQASGEFKGFVKIMATAPHSIFVLRRTRPSQGAYVPVLNARIKFGNHPGTKANPMFKETRERIRIEAQQILNRHYGPGQFNIIRFIK